MLIRLLLALWRDFQTVSPPKEGHLMGFEIFQYVTEIKLGTTDEPMKSNTQ